MKLFIDTANLDEIREAAALDAAGTVAEGFELRRIADDVVVEVPMTLEGLQALRIVSERTAASTRKCSWRAWATRCTYCKPACSVPTS